jgi:predicted RNA polymerase sigma factor
MLLSALATLAPKQRQVVVLRHWRQMSTEETARALGMSTGTVKSTLHRALARLREELGPVPRNPEQALEQPNARIPTQRRRSDKAASAKEDTCAA